MVEDDPSGRPSTALADDCAHRHHFDSRKRHCPSCGLPQQSVLCELQRSKIRRVVLSGADLTQFSIAYNGGNSFLLSRKLGADGFVNVSNERPIFKVVAA